MTIMMMMTTTTVVFFCQLDLLASCTFKFLFQYNWSVKKQNPQFPVIRIIIKYNEMMMMLIIIPITKVSANTEATSKLTHYALTRKRFIKRTRHNSQHCCEPPKRKQHELSQRVQLAFRSVTIGTVPNSSPTKLESEIVNSGRRPRCERKLEKLINCRRK